LRLQIRQNEIEQLKQVLEHRYLAEQTAFNNLLNSANNIEVIVVDQLNIPSEDFDINATSLELHPELLKYEKLYNSVAQSELLNQKESSPMIGFGL
jgi:cobalt-zinc-cadmium efflux system outer membrane protein